MKSLVNMLRKDENALSVGRVCAVVAFILFAGVSVYIAILGRTWGNYEAFSAACVGFMLAQLGNKYVDIKGVKIGGDKDAR